MEFQFYGKRSKTSQQRAVATSQIDHCRSGTQVRAHELHTASMKFHRHEALGGDFTIASRYLRFGKGFAHTLERVRQAVRNVPAQTLSTQRLQSRWA